MTSSSAARLQAQKAEAEALINGASRTKVAPKQEAQAQEADPRFANIKGNPFYAAVFSPTLSPDEKVAAITKLTTITDNKEETKANFEAHDLFKEYLQELRKQMSLKLIGMSDTRNFAIVRDVIEDMNKGLEEVNALLDPLVEILDAFDAFEDTDAMLDAFQTIQTERSRSSELRDQAAAIVTEFNAQNNTIRELEVQINSARNDKGWFGGQKADARERQARLEFELIEAQRKREEIAARDLAVKNELNAIPASEDKVAQARQALRKMLDTSSEDHEANGRQLLEKAQAFVRTSDAKTATVREQMKKQGGQIANLDDMSRQTNFVFALLEEGTKKSTEQNLARRGTLDTPVGEENTVQRLARESKLRDTNELIDRLNNSITDTNSTIVELTGESIKIENMKQSNLVQQQQIRTIHSQGIASVAGQLSTVIEAIGAQAQNEAKNVITATLNRMNDRTNAIANKQSIKTAEGLHERNAELESAVATLQNIGKVRAKAAEITREALAGLAETNRVMESTARELASRIEQDRGAAADSIEGKTQEQAKQETAAPTNELGMPTAF